MSFDPLSVDVPRLLVALRISASHEGDRWIARCPNPAHLDHAPSWDIVDMPNTAKHGITHCFSCGFGGTATDLVMAVTKLSFHGARDWIVERAMGQQSLIRNTGARADSSDAKPFHMPPEAVFVPFSQWPEIPRRYVCSDKRRITTRQVARWGLGYAVNGRLAGRIVIPARDSLGVLQSYTARTFAGSPRRYLNPKKQERPHDGAVFGEQYWPPPSERDLVVVTEGAFNALAVERVAPTLPLASLFGSNVETRHVSKLGTFKRALLLTDPDAAGDRAAEKLAVLSRHLRTSRVVLERPSSMAPDEKVDANSVPPEVLRRALVDAWKKFR